MGSVFPIRSGAPDLADSDLATSLDFHIASTNFLKTVDIYINEIGVSYAYNHTKHTSDPITSQVNFFEKLNNGTFKFKGDDIGGKSKHANNYLTRIDPLLNDTEVWLLGDDGLPEKESNRYHAFDLRTGQDRWITALEDTDTLVKTRLDSFKSEYGISKMDHQFMLYWVKKFHRAHTKVKEEYKKLVTDETTNYFTEFSDCLGILSRYTVDTPDNTVIPLIDFNYDQFDDSVAGSDLNPVMADKLDFETSLLIMEMAIKTNTLHRSNLIKVIKVMADSNEAHGEDLVADTGHRRRLTPLGKLYQDLSGIISSTVGAAYQLLLSSRMDVTNQLQIKNPSLELVVENSIVKVDLLKNKIIDLNKLTTNSDVLKVV